MGRIDELSPPLKHVRRSSQLAFESCPTDSCSVNLSFNVLVDGLRRLEMRSLPMLPYPYGTGSMLVLQSSISATIYLALGSGFNVARAPLRCAATAWPTGGVVTDRVACGATEVLSGYCRHETSL